MTTLELILPPLLAIGGGVIGYFYRESQNRSKPFMTFGKIEELRNNQDDITIPEHIIDTLRNNFYAKELYPKMKVKDFYSTWDRCDDFRRFSEDAINKLVSFKSVYMGIFYDFFIAQIQLLLMSTAQQKSFLCENGPPRSSSEHRGLFCGKSATYSFLLAVST